MAWDQSLLNGYLREKRISILLNHLFFFFFQGWGKQFENVLYLIQKCVLKSEILTAGVASGKEPTCQCRGCRRCGFNPLDWEDLLEKGMAATPVFLPGESHGERSLVGHRPWDRTELDRTEAT